MINTYYEYLVQHLMIVYQIPVETAVRYAKVLQNRAIRFYINGQLDESVIAEDLSNGNLKYNEAGDREWLQKESETLKQLAEVE